MNQLPDISSELQFQTSRSGGAGGQHVNKVETKVEARFSVPASSLISDAVKDKLLERLTDKLTSDGVLIVTSQHSRSQLQNKEIAIKKLHNILKNALTDPKRRKATRPTRAAVEKRLKSKKSQSLKKLYRNKPEC